MLANLFLVPVLFSFLASDAWRELSFEKITPNKITYGPEILRVEVDRSASPLLHLFPERRKIDRLRLSGRVVGDWSFPTGEGWNESPDDALLRIGLIENGDRKLNAIEKLAAPDWIRDLENATASFADGIGTIRCFHLMPEESWVGQTRTNPNMELFLETVAAAPGEDGSFEIEVELDSPVDSLGLWLLADGDDSGATFTVEIETLEVGVAP